MKLELRNVTKRFGAVLANDHLNITIDSGTIHAIVGENGAGKSTAMRIAYGFYTADTGDKFANQADTIYDFSDVDQIYLKGNYGYAGATLAPGEGQYGITGGNGNWTVTYNSPTDSGWHDIIVKGDNPLNDISFF